MDTVIQFNTPGIAFILTLIFGFWLSNTGKPYNGILFNVHKLIALGAVIITAMQVSKVLKGMDSQTLIISLVIFTGLCIFALFASGALMSAEKLDYKIMLTIHRIAPFLIIAIIITSIYLLTG